MADHSGAAASFWTQTDALLRKNLIFQKRNLRMNVLLVSFPVLLCLLLLAAQITLDRLAVDLEEDLRKLPAYCSGSNCPVPTTPETTPKLRLPDPQYRAVKTNFIPFKDLPDESCKKTMSCPVTVLVTGNNQSLGQLFARNMFANDVLGKVYEDGSSDNGRDFIVQDRCRDNSTLSLNVLGTRKPEAKCVQGLHLWRNSSSVINDELYKGYQNGNSEKKTNEIIAAYDFLNSNRDNFYVTIWHNSTIYSGSEKDELMIKMMGLQRVVNLVSNAYLKFLKGPGAELRYEFIKDMPKYHKYNRIDVGTSAGQYFFVLIILQLFPVVLKSLVYEKQQKLRIMMKMHGLGDGPYWMISYTYFLIVSLIYMLGFVIFGSAIGLKFFRLNDYTIQFVFYFIYLNLQISFAFLLSAFFTKVKTASVIAYLCIFATLFLGSFFLEPLLKKSILPRSWAIVLELFPFLSLYRGVYELAQYAIDGFAMGSVGMRWKDLNDRNNGMKDVLKIMLIDWVVVFFLACYADHVTSSGKSWLFFLQTFRRKPLSHSQRTSLERQRSGVYVQMDKPDVEQEREKVEDLLRELNSSHAVICDNLKKIYQGKDGNPEKFAVKGLSLALPKGECFGMLGPNGAGKTSFIHMMIGLQKPTSGTAFVEGLDLRTELGRIHSCIGVCPQHDLLWETLTGREHLLFYGRLKNLEGSALTQAVEESLQTLNLYYGGVADKKAGEYSGGMKRRLSVAISLIGDPKVVYLDEPSTGLDPASRNSLWNVVLQAKQSRAIILTTHSMEEAEALCDRIGIFVDGSLQCIGNPKELRGRYGGSYVLTMTTSSEHDEEVSNLVRVLCPRASRVYHIAGTQKFELPKQGLRIGDVLKTVETAKKRFAVSAWGLADCTLEDVFIKVASQALRAVH